MAAREQLSGPIKIPDPTTATTPVLKARAYEPGALPSEPVRDPIQRNIMADIAPLPTVRPEVVFEGHAVPAAFDTD
jgi:hypothetical protein